MSLTLGKAYQQATYEEKVEFSKTVRDKLLKGFMLSLDALVYECEHSKNSGARVSAAKQLQRMAFIAGIFDRDELKNFMNEFGAEFEKLGIG
jgi:hypothetical protein